MTHKFSEIEGAFDFVASGSMYTHEALLNTETGEVYYRSHMADIDEFPEDTEDDKYINIPHKNELNLGKDLVFRFAAQNLPEKLDEVERIFIRGGAYSRYKNLLERAGQLDEWYEFENAETEKTLREWCAEQKIELED